MRKSRKDCCTKTGRLMFVLAAVSLMFAFFVQASWAATYYMPDDFSNLQAAMAGMSSGDELIIRDGVYVGVPNTITTSAKPPNGTVGQYTVVRAEHDGKVFFDGENIRNVFNLTNASYISFKGLVWCNCNFAGAASLVPVNVCNHIKFFNCGAYNSHDGDDGHVFDAYSSSYLLYEGCYVWGSGDYAFIPGRDTEKVIYRQCVVRQDRQKGWPQATIGFFPYGSRDIEIQNCIYVDANNPLEYYDARPVPWEFRYADQGFELQNVNFRGCVAINNTVGGISRGSTTSINTSVLFSNCVSIGSYWGARFRYNGANIDHCTFYDISAPSDSTWGRGVYFEGQGDNARETISNSIVAKIPNSIGIIQGNSDHNCLYGNKTNYQNVNITGDITNIDPSVSSLQYPLRIENNSDLSGKANDGGSIGATVMKKIGVPGTLWGEQGYNTVTTHDLWPFPNEGIIRENMRSYSDYGINGARGFCADGKQLNGVDDITLTSYIWEYLGNPIPPEIYGSNPPAPDTTPPVISNVGTNNITTTSATITWTTNESATSRVDYGETTGYGQQQTQTSLTASHQVALSGLQPGTTYHYKVTSSDSSNNSAASSDFSFTTEEYIAPDTTPPAAPTGLGVH